ncbi:ATP-binding protein [Myroides marinus]|nr:ATP-binding protein [Myroides marinus]MDM1353603.1 ATP-binding protein [Myroides marinus]MDM1367118.1 ATP-binding protein [Myroides marinus]MDM1372914.1 ATP-binding protein [Myroides marinus]
MFNKIVFYILMIIFFVSCTNKVGNQLVTMTEKKAVGSNSFVLSDSLYRSENSRLTKYLLTFSNHSEEGEDLFRFIKAKREKNNLIKNYSEALFLDDSVSVASSSFALGEFFQYNLAQDSSYYYYNKSALYYKGIKNKEHLQRTYLSLSILLCDRGIFQEAELYLDDAIALNNKNISAYTSYAQIHVMGMVKLGLEEYDKAIECFNQANFLLDNVEIKDQYNDYQIALNKLAIKNYLARAYISKHEYDIADVITNTALIDVNFLKEEDKGLFLPLLLNKKVRVKLRTEKYKEALGYITNLLEVDKRLGNEYSLNLDYILYAEYFFRTGDITKARQYVDKALVSARKYNDLLTQKKALELLLIYDKENINANFYSYKEVNERINQSNNTVRSSFAKLKYESDSLVTSIELLKNQYFIIVTVSTTVVLVLLGVLIFIVFRNKAKEINMVQMYQKDTEKYYDSIIHIQNKVNAVQEIERKKFAKELHDGVLNKLFVTRFSLQQLEEEDLQSAKDMLANEVQEVETFIRHSSQALLNEDKFLVSDFKQLIEELVMLQNRSKNTYFSCFIDTKLDLEILSHRVKVNIYRILQEAFQNVQKYAEASACVLELVYVSETTFTIVIHDNGKGFDVKTIKKGLGLKNMGDRLHAINSKLAIDSKEGVGTVISFDILLI